MISNLWDTDPIYVSNMKLKQILVLAGNGNLYQETTSQELRQFLAKIDLPTMSKYIEDALSSNKDDKFDERGYVLQDIVNEMGSRCERDGQQAWLQGDEWPVPGQTE